MKILSIFGTRPEAVKMAPVAKALAKTEGVESLVCVTAQHREMLDQILNIFQIVPDFDLDLMQPDQTLASLTAEIFVGLNPILKQILPDWVFVQGDTTTVTAAALTAYYHKIKVGHIEAGLRTGDKWKPFPEEINRRVASVVADLHFAPTELSRKNLLNEGIPDEQIVVTGNPVIDALNSVKNLPIPSEVKSLLEKLGLPIDANQKSLNDTRLVLVTAHRRENFGQPLENICSAVHFLANKYRKDVQFVYPVHLNPNIQEPVYRLLGDQSNITLLPPLDYLPLVSLLQHSYLVLTDSGGLQEEAPGLGIPVLVMREVTERPEAIQVGTVRLVGTDSEHIISEMERLLDDPRLRAKMAQAKNPYGDGHAAERIVRATLNFQAGRDPRKIQL
ncbi:non-hydrolyzing UDP-N-acetylglucosamine 2-epimerase [Chloroflexota bacterium]